MAGTAPGVAPWRMLTTRLHVAPDLMGPAGSGEAVRQVVEVRLRHVHPERVDLDAGSPYVAATVILSM